MSIITKITTLPDTLQTFEKDINNNALISGIFLHADDVYFSDENNFIDINEWYLKLANKEIIPLHNALEMTSSDEAEIYIESKQNFSYKSQDGRYRHKLKYNWSLAFKQIVDQIDNTNLRVIYWDRNWNVYATEDSIGRIQGFRTNRLALERMMFQISNEPAYSMLDIELYDTKELNKYGIIKKLTWNPRDIDRLFVNIKIDYIDSTQINFSVTSVLGEVDDIESNGVAITDDINGDTTFSLFNNTSGTYKVSGLSNNITTGKLSVLTTIYIGCTQYKVHITTPIESTFLLLDDDDFALLDDDGFNLLENMIEILVQNGGYSTATDFINVGSDGFPQYWNNTNSSLGYTTPSVVTGNGFTGNALRLQCNISNVILNIRNTQIFNLTLGKEYNLKFMYRSNTYASLIQIGTNIISGFTANTGNAILFTGNFIATDTDGILQIYKYSAQNGDYFEIDEVRIEELN